MNEMIAAAKGAGGRGYAYSKLKAKWTKHIALLARSARIGPVTLASFEFLWSEVNQKRDLDNIAAGGRKLVLDGLVEAEVIPNDGWANVRGWIDRFIVCQPGEKPGVTVTIVEAT
jgi:hypothetical protein